MEWRDVPGYEGRYQVSADGRVRGLGRYGRESRGTRDARGRYGTHLTDAEGRRRFHRVHRLVALAFLGPPPTAAHRVCHDDGDPSNNAATNLRWDTQAGNVRDTVTHGRHNQARKTHCPKGHEYTPANTIRRPTPQGWGRTCRTCQNARTRAWRANRDR